MNIQSDSIVRQMNKVHFVSYTMMNNNYIFYYNILTVFKLSRLDNVFHSSQFLLERSPRFSAVSWASNCIGGWLKKIEEYLQEI